MARSFHELFPTSPPFLLPARHYVQIDEPARVADLLLTVPLAPVALGDRQTVPWLNQSSRATSG
jgi:hypothetical protein